MFGSLHDAGAGILPCFVLLSSTCFHDFGTEKDTCLSEETGWAHGYLFKMGRPLSSVPRPSMWYALTPE